MKKSLFAAWMVLAFAVAASAQCKPPRFREGRNFINPKFGHGALYVSMRPKDFTLNNITCLSQSLRSRHGEWKSVIVMMFGSRDAAENFLPTDIDYPKSADLVKWAKQLHAMYSFDSEKHEEYVEILPLGYNGMPSANTRIDLPVAGVPNCHLELEGRCVIALESLDYPMKALQAGISGSITLAGTIARNGEFQGVRLSESDVTPKDGTDTLANAAIESLSKWRVETKGREDHIRIVYDYVIVKSSSSATKATCGSTCQSK